MENFNNANSAFSAEVAKAKEAAEKIYSGVDTDIADAEKDSKALVDEATRDLNNNHAGDSDFNPSAV